MHNNNTYDEHEEMVRSLAKEHFLENLSAGKAVDTCEKYEARGNRLLKKYFYFSLPTGQRPKRREFDWWGTLLLDLLWNPLPFFAYLIEIRNSLKTVSWRQYRASLTYWFLVRRLFWMAEAVQQISSEGCYTKRNPPPGGPRTSSNGMKSFPAEMQIAMCAALIAHKSEWAKLALLWIRVGILFGLRPRSEWPTAVLVPAAYPEKAYLLVENAKQKNADKYGLNRAHGPTRKIVLENISDEHYSLLQDFISWKDHASCAEYDRAYVNCQTLIRKVGRKLWPRRKKYPVLYSCRHQFVANAKAAKLSRIKIAALMGHATDATASMVYARKQWGAAGAFYVAAHQEDVERIRPVYEAVDFESLSKSKLRALGYVSDSSLSDEDDFEEMWAASSDEPDFDPSQSMGPEESDFAEPDSVAKKNKKPNGGGDFEPS